MAYHPARGFPRHHNRKPFLKGCSNRIGMAPEVILRGACSSDNDFARICGSTEVVPYCKTTAPNSSSSSCLVDPFRCYDPVLVLPPRLCRQREVHRKSKPEQTLAAAGAVQLVLCDVL